MRWETLVRPRLIAIETLVPSRQIRLTSSPLERSEETDRGCPPDFRRSGAPEFDEFVFFKLKKIYSRNPRGRRPDGAPGRKMPGGGFLKCVFSLRSPLPRRSCSAVR